MSNNQNTTRLYLSLSPLVQGQSEAVNTLLAPFLSKLDIACINIPLIEKSGDQNSPAEQQQQKELISTIQEKNIAVLSDTTAPHYVTNRKSFEKALENARKSGCDGLHMSADMDLFARAREVLGPDAIIGIDCGISRHAAMQLGEAGADYVGFQAPLATHNDEHDLNKGISESDNGFLEPETVFELVDWWQQLFEVPCVALNIADQSEIEKLLEIPADFIALEQSVWSDMTDDNALLGWLAAKCPVA